MTRMKKKGMSNCTGYAQNVHQANNYQASPAPIHIDKFLGIYPREPRNKKKVSKRATPSTTFYYTKDIQYLLHEPLLEKFRDHKALAKKIGRALGRGEVGDATRLEKSKPKMRLDHIIKERYPTFVDALRDLDDALSMLFLFANLPSTTYVPPKTIALCQRLCLEFEHYLIETHTLRKSFLSIKGIYYQATIQGQDILWLVPYKFVQRMAGDIDFRIMGTFIEFYTTLLGFINYRLFTSIGLVYPPKFDSSSDDRGGELGAITLESKAIEGAPTTNSTNGHSDSNGRATVDAQAEADRLAELDIQGDEEEPTAGGAEEDVANDALDTFEPATAQDADVLLQPQFGSVEAGTLFSDFTFFLGRETPRAPLEFLLKSFGCKRVGWDAVLGDGGFITNDQDPRITHQIVDRPNLPPNAFPEVPVETEIDADGDEVIKKQPSAVRIPGRTYIQPQWVWDCINQGKLLRPDLYAPGATLPPHLSPWMKPKSGQYDPTAPLVEQEKEGEAELHAEEIEEEEEDEEEYDEDAEEDEDSDAAEDAEDKEENTLFGEGEVEAGEGMRVDGDTDDDSEDEQEVAEEFDGFSDDDEDEVSDTEKERIQHQREIEAEAAGLPFSTIEAGRTPGKSLARKKADKTRKDAQEELDRQRMMLPNKKRKLFDKMQYGNKQREAEAEKLRKKKRKLEKKAAV
ncbi:mRNA-binding ribosome synthesis protein nop7 [Venturia inaequalis]|uniref:Pescadillo homolog n=1 Tax=Venturia inaequalis TaxID=5025 RepID=A0A8H3U7T0_VENIN|nr:mRNA-binding ribosome synthesis protein nop7 [Venturia inaequalis]